MPFTLAVPGDRKRQAMTDNTKREQNKERGLGEASLFTEKKTGIHKGKTTYLRIVGKTGTQKKIWERLAFKDCGKNPLECRQLKKVKIMLSRDSKLTASGAQATAQVYKEGKTCQRSGDTLSEKRSGLRLRQPTNESVGVALEKNSQ